MNSQTAFPDLGVTPRLRAGQVLSVIDLTTDPARRPLWRSNPPLDANSSAAAGLSRGGTSSPLGFWLGAPADPAALPATGLKIVFVEAGEESSDDLAVAPDGSRGRPAQTVRIKSPNAGDGDILLTIGAGGARVVAGASAWKGMAEPVLLAACLYWRFAAVDRELARLTECAHADIGHATMSTPSSLTSSRLLEQRARDVRTLLVDLPHFEGPLTDPFPYCTTERAAHAFSALAEKLHLEEWCELIDEKAEAVEDTYEAVTEKLFEYKNFAWEAALEAVIVVILLAELSLALWETFSP